MEADPRVAYEVLRDLTGYARWWPEVRSVIPIDFDRAVVRIVGILPYALELIMEREREDPVEGVLRARLSGDLEGFSRWCLQPDGKGCRLIYDQEVQVNKPLLRALAPVARPLLRMNHSLMMARGRRGLRSHLAALSR